MRGGDYLGYLALYRKYRPNNFEDLVGQSEVSSIIKNEILNNKISHAYLFSGPRGTGKTSTAKIIARMINCTNLSSDGIPCGICDSCLNFSSSSDIVEIDAASNNGVDEIRELRDKVNLVPTFGKYKIYIIDEVHMLTTQAFNALLKTLEEPPSHVIFILATTEFYKIPVTVVSRCQKFQFLKFSNDEIVKKLTEIASKESILAGEDVLFEIARLSDGGLRDAINMLDQLSSFKATELSIYDVYKLNGVVSYSEFSDLLHYIYSNDIVKIINFLDELDKSGKNYDRFIEDLISFLKDILVYKNTSILTSNISEKNDSLVELADIFTEKDLYDFIFSLNDLITKIRNSSFGKILLITEFIRFSNLLLKSNNLNFSENSNEEIIKNYHVDNYNYPNIINENKNKINLSVTNSKCVFTDKLKKIRINNTFATASKVNKENLISKWSLVVEKLSNDVYYASIAGMMNDIEILVVGDKNIIFLAQYDSLLDRLFSQIELIEHLLADVFDVEYKVVFLLRDEWAYEKEKYISSLKSGKKYVYIEENVDEIDDKKNSNVDTDLDKIVSILGSDVISYKE